MLPDPTQTGANPGDPADAAARSERGDSTVNEAAGSRRRFGRVRIENLSCSLGTVIDLSAGGMRVITSRISAKKAGETIPVELSSTRHSVRILAEVMWGKRIGFRKHIVGLRFLNVSDEDRRRIGTIARAYAIRMGIGA